jgi:hypothetical protein
MNNMNVYAMYEWMYVYMNACKYVCDRCTDEQTWQVRLECIDITSQIHDNP